MNKRSKRLQKKLHKHWLEYGVIDLSQQSVWRKKLFESEIDTPFLIDAEHCEGLSKEVQRALKRYDLAYEVRKVSAEMALESWLVEGGLVLFEFRAKTFPCIKAQTGNNPDII